MCKRFRNIREEWTYCVAVKICFVLFCFVSFFDSSNNEFRPVLPQRHTGIWPYDSPRSSRGLRGGGLQCADEMTGISQLSPPPRCSLGWTPLQPCVPHCPHSGPGQQGPQVQADQRWEEPWLQASHYSLYWWSCYGIIIVGSLLRVVGPKGKWLWLRTPFLPWASLGRLEGGRWSCGCSEKHHLATSTGACECQGARRSRLEREVQLGWEAQETGQA